MPVEEPYKAGQPNQRDEINNSASQSNQDESKIIDSILSKISRKVEDGMFTKTYILQSTEALMLLKLQDESTVNNFKSLSLKGQKELIHSYVMDNWGDVLGVDHCYTYVMFGEQVLTYADIKNEIKVDDITIEFNKPLPPKQ